MTVTNDIKYVGVNDHQVDLFEGQYIVPNGMAYNSYVIMDDKIAVMDTVDINFKDEQLGNIEKVLEGRKPDYLIVQHMEPDHSANIQNFLEKYPEATVVGNAKIFTMMDQFFKFDVEIKKHVVADKDTLSLGKHQLTFVFAPMVHWPEVMVTYDSTDKVLFSADAFGKFGALDTDEDWACEARRYYFNIVGKYGVPVQGLLKKASKLDIQIICPTHGPVLTENLDYYLDLYNTWSTYQAETEGVFVAYCSIHGNTTEAVGKLEEILKSKTDKKVVVTDLSRCDMAEAIEDAFRYSKLIVAAPSYDAGVFPVMADFLHHLKIKAYQNRKVAIVENGSWAPTAARTMKGYLEEMKNVTICDTVVTIKSRATEDTYKEMEKLADEILA